MKMKVGKHCTGGKELMIKTSVRVRIPAQNMCGAGESETVEILMLTTTQFA